MELLKDLGRVLMFVFVGIPAFILALPLTFLYLAHYIATRIAKSAGGVLE